MHLKTTTIAAAFFSLIKNLDQAKVTAIIKELTAFHNTFTHYPELKSLLSHPAINLDKKKQAIEHYYQSQLKLSEVASLLFFLLKTKKIPRLPLIIFYLQKLRDTHFNILNANITSAQALSPAEKDRLKQRLTELFSVKTVELMERVDQKLLGGLKINLANQLMDGSLKKKLLQIEHSLI